MFCLYCGSKKKNVFEQCRNCGRKEAAYCIGDYDSTFVDVNEKKDIETQIGQFYPDAAIKQISAFCMIAFGIVSFFIMFRFMPNPLMWVFLMLTLLFIVAGILLWGLSGCIPYAAWKRAIKDIRTHPVHKIQVHPSEWFEGKGIHKEKYVLFEINGDKFADYYPVNEDVYQKKDTIELWAYFLEYTEKDHRNNRYLKKFGIFIVGKE